MFPAFSIVSNLLPSVLPFYAVTYHANPPLLRGLSLRALNPEELTETCEVLLTAAQHFGCPYWLLDGRANPDGQPPSLRQWLREEYFPRVRAALGLPLHVAYLVTPEFRAVIDQLGLGQVDELQPAVGWVGWFTQEATALAWLEQQRLVQPPRNSAEPGVTT